MKNLFLTIILSSTCFMMYGQVKGPDKGVKVTNTPTSTESSSVIYKGKEKAVNVMPSKPKPVVSPVGRAVKPGSQGEKVKPTGNSKPSGASSAAPDFTGTVSEWYETLIETINDVSAQIHL